MSPTPIQASRVAFLDKLGEEHVFETYHRLGSVRKMVWELFDAREPGTKPSHRAFYKWLDAEEGRRERWEEEKRIRAHTEFDQIGELADDMDETNARSYREKIKAKQWRAERLSPRDYGRTETHKHEVTINNEWLEAMQHAEQARIPEAEHEVVEGETVDEGEEV